LPKTEKIIIKYHIQLLIMVSHNLKITNNIGIVRKIIIRV